LEKTLPEMMKGPQPTGPLLAMPRKSQDIKLAATGLDDWLEEKKATAPIPISARPHIR
jgi:hypothetical protein